MNLDPVPASISNRMARLLAETTRQELGSQDLELILAKGGPPLAGLDGKALAQLEGPQAARVYAGLQQALRTYYGRGARGILQRIGRKMWDRLVLEATFREKAELEVTRRLPIPARRLRALAFLANRLQDGGGSASVHTLDLDLLLADRASAATLDQHAAVGLCYVTLGLVQGALFWATGQEADVEETACKAAGAPACEFRVTFGGG